VNNNLAFWELMGFLLQMENVENELFFFFWWNNENYLRSHKLVFFQKQNIRLANCNLTVLYRIIIFCFFLLFVHFLVNSNDKKITFQTHLHGICQNDPDILTSDTIYVSDDSAGSHIDFLQFISIILPTCF
jgi:hypothetical protein